MRYIRGRRPRGGDCRSSTELGADPERAELSLRSDDDTRRAEGGVIVQKRFSGTFFDRSLDVLRPALPLSVNETTSYV